MIRVKDIRNLLSEEYKNKNFVTDKTGIKTIEIIGTSFLADEDHIFGTPNYDYIKKELKWYESQSLNVYDIEDTPKIWKQVADANGFINSNYGWCIFSNENGNQFTNCLNELKYNPFSRRAVMIYNRPEMWKDYNKNGRSDFICTYSTQYFIRNNKLITYVLMRSNDAWAGYRNDFAWHKYVTEKLLLKLNENLDELDYIEMGDMFWTSGSLHVYERQFYLIEDYLK